MMNELWYALRRMRARPLHTLMVITVLALGTGATLTVLRIANAVLLQPLPYFEPDRLTRISMRMPILPNTDIAFSEVGIRRLESATQSLSDLAAYRVTGVNLVWRDRPHRVLSARVTGNFFELLGQQPRIGRGFSRGDEAAGKPPMVVLSDRFWRGTFGADPSMIGATVRLDGVPGTIVGVAGPHMTFPSSDIDYWTQMEMSLAGEQPYQIGLQAVARLKPGVSEEAANADATQVMRQYTRDYPGPHGTRDMDVSGFYTTMRPIRDDMVGGARPTLVLLGLAVLFVLCLTCVNVATLELVRSSGQRSELAIRAALGAGQARLVGGALTEGLLQSIAGTLVGFAISVGAVTLMQSLLPAAFDPDSVNVLGIWIVAGVAALVLLCTTASAAFPIAAALGHDVQSGLRDRTSGGSLRMVAIRRALVVVQFAAACMLVDGAILMNVTVREAQRVPLGFDAEGIMTFRLSLPPENYQRRDEVVTAYREVIDRLRAIPGVVNAGVSTTIPLGADQQEALFGIDGRVFRADGSDPQADYRIVSPGYLPTLGVQIVEGRGFNESDAFQDGTPVVVSQELAREYFKEGSAVGQRIRTGMYAPWMTVVGVASDARNRSLTEPPRPELYLPFAAPRSPMGITRDMYIVMRTDGSVDALRAAAQRAIRDMNPELPIYGVRSLVEIRDASQVREVTTTRTLTGFAIAALVLAMAGTYSILMFAVVQRRRELALRQAVGATSTSLVAMIGSEVGGLLAIGAGAGLVGTVLVSRLLSSFLFEVSALDPRVAAATLLVIGGAGLAAAIIPARRAGAVDPMLVLRE